MKELMDLEENGNSSQGARCASGNQEENINDYIPGDADNVPPAEHGVPPTMDGAPQSNVDADNVPPAEHGAPPTMDGAPQSSVDADSELSFFTAIAMRSIRMRDTLSRMRELRQEKRPLFFCKLIVTYPLTALGKFVITYPKKGDMVHYYTHQ